MEAENSESNLFADNPLSDLESSLTQVVVRPTSSADEDDAWRVSSSNKQTLGASTSSLGRESDNGASRQREVLLAPSGSYESSTATADKLDNPSKNGSKTMESKSQESMNTSSLLKLSYEVEDDERKEHPIIETETTTQPRSAMAAQQAVSASATTPAQYTARFLVLCSGMSLKRESVANQEMAYTILDGLNLPYDKVDGAEPVNKDRRNELFDISGIRGQYPLFFIVNNGTTTFFGDWDTFLYSNDEGILGSSLLAQGATATSTQDLAALPLAPPAGRNPLLAPFDKNPPPPPQMAMKQPITANATTGPQHAPEEPSPAVRRVSKLCIPDRFGGNNQSDPETKQPAPRRVSKLSPPKSFSSKSKESHAMKDAWHHSAPKLSIPDSFVAEPKTETKANTLSPPRRTSKLTIPTSFGSKSHISRSTEPERHLSTAPMDKTVVKGEEPPRSPSKLSIPTTFGSKSEPSPDAEPEHRPQTTTTDEAAEVSETIQAIAPLSPRQPSKVSIPKLFGRSVQGGSSSDASTAAQPRRLSKKLVIPDTFAGHESHGSLDYQKPFVAASKGTQQHIVERDGSGKVAEAEIFSAGAPDDEAETDLDAPDLGGLNETKSLESAPPVIHISPRRDSRKLPIPPTFGGPAEVHKASSVIDDDVDGSTVSQHYTPIVESPRRASKLVIPGTFGGQAAKSEDLGGEMSASALLESHSSMRFDERGFGIKQGSVGKLVIPGAFGASKSNLSAAGMSASALSHDSIKFDESNSGSLPSAGSPRRESRKLAIPSTFGGPIKPVADAAATKATTPHRVSKKLVIPATFGGSDSAKEAVVGPPPPKTFVAPRRTSKTFVVPDPVANAGASADLGAPPSHVETQGSELHDVPSETTISEAEATAVPAETEATITEVVTEPKPLSPVPAKPSKLTIPGAFGGAAAAVVKPAPTSSPVKKRLTIPGAFAGGIKPVNSAPVSPVRAAAPRTNVVAVMAPSLSDGGSGEEESGSVISDTETTVSATSAAKSIITTASPGPRKKLSIPGAFAKSVEPPKKFGGGVGW